jgi:hypothetical protein
MLRLYGTCHVAFGSFAGDNFSVETMKQIALSLMRDSAPCLALGAS